MKVIRTKSVWSALLRVLSSPGGRSTIEYISLTQLEKDELQGEYGVAFSAHVDISDAGTMSLESWSRDGTVAVRIEAQDKHSRARRVVEGVGNERTR